MHGKVDFKKPSFFSGHPVYKLIEKCYAKKRPFLVGANVPAAEERGRQVRSERLMQKRRALLLSPRKARRFRINLSERTCLPLSSAAGTLAPTKNGLSFA